MSVSISNIVSDTNTSFISRVSSITQAITNNSDLVSTCSFVKSFISNFFPVQLIPINNYNNIMSTINFTSIRANKIAGSPDSGVNLLIQGTDIIIGKIGSSITILGNNINFFGLYRYMFCCRGTTSGTGSRLIAGTSSASTTASPLTYTEFALVPVIISGSLSNDICGQYTVSKTGANLISTSTTSNNINWVVFGS